jgi:hypothetical protein
LHEKWLYGSTVSESDVLFYNVLATQAKTAAIDSHMVVSKNENTLKGTMVLSNSDQDSIRQSKDALSDQLTQKVQADTKNSNSRVEVSDVRQLSDGTLALDYECQEVSDTETAKKTLNKAVKGDDVKQVIASTPKVRTTTTSKPKQPTTSQQSK